MHLSLLKLKNFIHLFILLQLVLSSLSFAALELSQNQFEALQNAIQQGNYPVRILESEVSGVSRHVILVGESHRVTYRRHELGTQLIRSFNLIGVEGLDLSSLPELKQIELKQMLEKCYRIAGYCMPWKAGAHLGPITLSGHRFIQEQQEKTESERQFIQWLWSYERDPESFIKLFDRSPGVTVGALIPSFQGAVRLLDDFKRDEVTIEPKQIEAIISQMREKYFGDSGLDLVQLEDFEPIPQGFVEYVHTINKILPPLGVCLASAGTLTSALLLKNVLPQPFTKCVVATSVLTASAACLYMGGCFNRFLPEMYQIHLAKLDQDGSPQRNQTMCKNIVKALNLRPQEKTMLVIAGARHIPEMLSILTEKFKFHEVPLPE